ncbi:hypothetical protein BRC68_05940 [Halobacteriales archaeon QH_6_64_20]|nr:MAG: hypothetical protein BRC68_05940 [Halobacteriales archaeon QH_6_64_20]
MSSVTPFRYARVPACSSERRRYYETVRTGVDRPSRVFLVGAEAGPPDVVTAPCDADGTEPPAAVTTCSLFELCSFGESVIESF